MIRTEREIKSIELFCGRIGEIVAPVTNEMAEKTAIEEIKKFFGEFQLSGQGRLTIGRVCDSTGIQELCKSGGLKIGGVSAEDDGFEIKSDGDDVVVAGANARGVLYGVYELEEQILAGTAVEDKFIVPHFRKRSDALGHYHNGRTFNFGNDVIDEKKAEYLARLRVNQFCACFDGSPFGSHLAEFVHSGVFPFQREPSREAVTTLRRSAETLAKYGIDFIMMLWEPALPALYAPLDEYPQEALGRVRRPWGGDENNMDTTFCVNSQIVQEYYRDLMHRFVREYPMVRGFFFYNLDGSAWLCTPELCPRCAENLVDSDPASHTPWETQAKLATLLAEAAHEEDPSVTFNFWGAVHFHGDAVRKMLDTADGCDSYTTGASGRDHDMYIADKEHPFDEVRYTFEAAKRKKIPTYIYYAYNKLEAIQTGFPNPFVVAESIKTFKKWGADNLLEVTGPTPALNQINALAMRKFESEPDADADEWMKWLAGRQFGEAAGRKMLDVWRYTHDAFECWRDFGLNPLCGSQFMLRMGLFSCNNGDWELPLLLPPVLELYEDFFYNTLARVETWLLEDYRRYATEECANAFAAMGGYLAKAVSTAREAVALASEDERIGLCLYPGAFEGIERYTMKEYAKANLVPIEMAHTMCRQKEHLIRAVLLLKAMRDDPAADAALLKSRYLALLRDELTLQKGFSALLKRYSRERPCLALTGMCESEILMYKGFADDRAARIGEYLSKEM